MRYYLSLFFSAIFIISLQAQVAEVTPPDALLIRLQSKQRNIEALKESGRIEKAQELQERQEEENAAILKSVRANFDFVPVYFFYAKNSEEVRQGNFEGVIFDKEMNKVSLPASSKVLVAEFSETPQLDIKGLILLGQDLQPLESPFPKVIRRYRFFSLIEASKSKMIAELDQRLEKIYEK